MKYVKAVQKQSEKIASCVGVPICWSFSPSSFSLTSNMDQNTNINTVNTGIDMTKNYGNFTLEDILDGIFSQEEMDTWHAADWDVKKK